MMIFLDISPAAEALAQFKRTLEAALYVEKAEKMREKIAEIVATFEAQAADAADLARRTRERRAWPRMPERRPESRPLPVAWTASLRAFA